MSADIPENLKFAVCMNLAATVLQVVGAATPSWIVYETKDGKLGFGLHHFLGIDCSDERCEGGVIQGLRYPLVMYVFTVVLLGVLVANAWSTWKTGRPYRSADLSAGVIGMALLGWTLFFIVSTELDMIASVGYSPYLCLAAAVLTTVSGGLYCQYRLTKNTSVRRTQANANNFPLNTFPTQQLQGQPQQLQGQPQASAFPAGYAGKF